MSEFKAEVIKATIGKSNHRTIYTLRLTYPRIIHSEFMTHRVFSRNSSSSRAISTERMIQEVRDNPFIPSEFPKERPGMWAETALEGTNYSAARMYWLSALESALKWAESLASTGCHKQIVNRILEPFSWITVLVTATDWSNFFTLRMAKDAQPEIQEIAGLIKKAMNECTLETSDVHIPFYEGDTSDLLSRKNDLYEALMVSAGRCARVSYNKDSSDDEANRRLANRLLQNRHMSPFEHPCIEGGLGNWYNLWGWRSLRSIIDYGSNWILQEEKE